MTKESLSPSGVYEFLSHGERRNVERMCGFERLFGRDIAGMLLQEFLEPACSQDPVPIFAEVAEVERRIFGEFCENLLNDDYAAQRRALFRQCRELGISLLSLVYLHYRYQILVYDELLVLYKSRPTYLQGMLRTVAKVVGLNLTLAVEMYLLEDASSI